MNKPKWLEILQLAGAFAIGVALPAALIALFFSSSGTGFFIVYLLAMLVMIVAWLSGLIVAARKRSVR